MLLLVANCRINRTGWARRQQVRAFGGAEAILLLVANCGINRTGGA
jgi:hypothetical protein